MEPSGTGLATLSRATVFRGASGLKAAIGVSSPISVSGRLGAHLLHLQPLLPGGVPRQPGDGGGLGHAGQRRPALQRHTGSLQHLTVGGHLWGGRLCRGGTRPPGRTMLPNASTPLQVLRSSKKDEGTTVDIDAIMDNITIVLYTLTIVIGVSGNSVVIWVAGFKMKPKVTNVWLVNLAIADLIFCFTRIFSLIKKLFFDHWPFGEFVCKFNGFFKYANMFCSVFMLAVISLDRAFCVWLPVFTKRRRTVRAAQVAAVFVWATAVAFSTPYFVYRQVYLGKNNLSKCSLEVKEAKEGDNSTKLALYSIRFLCGFLLPFLVILACYITAGIGIRRTRLSGKSRPLRILASLVVAFFVCWGPYHCLLLVKMVDSENMLVKIWQPLARGVAYFNSCVNPLLYFCLGLNVRGRFRQSLAGVYRRAMADDADDQTTQSNERSLDDSSASKYSTVAGAGRSQPQEGVAKL